MKKGEKKKTHSKGKAGITLVALVVTIIVLIILAGVTLNIVLDQDGIIGKAKQSIEDYENAKKDEKENLSELEITMAKASGTTIQANGVSEIKLGESSDRPLKNYKIYGNLIQEGNPSPENPVTISQLGEDNVLQIKNYGRNQFKSVFDYNYQDHGLTVKSDIDSSTFFIDGNVNKEGNLLGSTGPVLKLGSYKIKIEGNYLDYYYIQIKTAQEDWTNLQTRMHLNQMYEFSLKEDSQIRIGISTGNIGTVYDNAEYKILIQDASIEDMSYEPYKSIVSTIDLTGHEPLRRVGDIADYIDYQNNRIVRNIEKLILTGEENFSIKSYNEDRSDWYYSLDINNAANDNGGKENCIATHYLYGAISNTTTNQGCNITWSKLRIRYGQEDSVENYKTWLKEQYIAGTPVMIYYQLAEPIYEDIILPDVNMLGGDHTTLEIISNIKPSKIEIEYYF